MRARKIAVAPVDDPPPDEPVEIYLPEETSPDEGSEPLDRVCLACGADGRPGGGCDHRETARLEAAPRALREAAARLRRAVAEQHAAARALRVLVLSEVAKGRGDLEEAPAKAAEPASPAPCPRCQLREAEAAAAGAEKPARRRIKGSDGQQALPFVRG